MDFTECNLLCFKLVTCKLYKTLLNTNLGCVTKELIEELSSEIDEDWTIVAVNLKFSRVAIQCLKKDYSKEGEHVVAFHMLMDWIKRCPRGYDKVSIDVNSNYQPFDTTNTQ